MHAIFGEGADARAAIARAIALAEASGTERERSHVEVIALAVGGQSHRALASALAHSDRWPRDTIVLSLPLGAFGLLAFSGMTDHDQARVDLVEQHAGHFEHDDWWSLTYRGWALAENGEVARGRAMLSRALEIRPANANGAHALAHALREAGSGDDATRLITKWLPTYDRAGILHGHIAWHAALAELERGDAAAVVSIYQEYVSPSASKGMPINIVSDAASLFWRLKAYSHSVKPGAWREIADYARLKFPEASHAFIDPHMAMIESMTGDHIAAETRIRKLEQMVVRSVSCGISRADT